ncbi:hypothetical protein EDD18DRAFT_1116959 [Armillaria luteobubalina]|uniref:Uncharacterized protein n=1 Tax=Armillaria luteobubalina TaxID=153913 RepID=A0AA39NZ53_9AGAR|nr:hypothetical protein EDD18DRAFT_1116959 [Armillaria luteobubalina]
MSFTTPSKSSSQIPSSPLAKVKLPHRLSLSGGNYDTASLKAQNIQLLYFRTHQAVVSFNPENQSLMLYEYPAYSDANGVSRPVLAEDLAQVRASNTNVMFPSCWCPAAFTGEYCETIIFTMSPLANAEYENPGKLALHCAASQPKLRLFGCGFFIPIQQLTSQGALGNPLRIPAPGRTKSASSLLHALDESFVGSSKRKFAVEPNSSPKKSRVLAPDSDTDFSLPPIRSHLEKSRRPGHNVQGSFPPKSTIEEFFQGTATFSHPSLRALEEAYTSGRGISLQEFRYLTDYCLDCGKVFTRLAHDKHLCFEVSQTQPRRMRIPKTEKGKEKARPSSDIFTSTPLDDVIVIRSDSDYSSVSNYQQNHTKSTSMSPEFHFCQTYSFVSVKPRHFNAMYCTLENLRQDGSRIVVPIFSLLLQLFFILMGKVQGPVTGGGSRRFLGCPSPRNRVDLCKDPNATPENPTPIADPSTLQDGHPDAVNETGHTLLVPQNEIDTPGGKKQSMHTEVVRAFKKLTRIGARWRIDDQHLSVQRAGEPSHRDYDSLLPPSQLSQFRRPWSPEPFDLNPWSDLYDLEVNYSRFPAYTPSTQRREPSVEGLGLGRLCCDAVQAARLRLRFCSSGSTQSGVSRENALARPIHIHLG